ncbi:MAG: hypothetical protein ACJ8J0_07785 [Longimicrobiaceae bacterium]
MRLRFLALLVAGLTLAATPAAAQHCWPTMVALVVRDAQGAVIDPAPLMGGFQYSPRRGETADFEVRRALVHPMDTNRFDQPGGTPVIAWHGQGDYRVDMREAVLRRGDTVMRLWMDLHLDSERHPGAGSFLLESPPFAPGTWRLDVCALPEAESHRYTPVPARWVRVSPSGEPGTPWQPPRGCEGAAGR